MGRGESWKRCWILGAVFALTVAAPMPTLAQDRGDPSVDAEARSLFEAGRTAFDAGRYADALEYFERSHELSGRSALLYNIGSAADRLRRDEEALRAFERYLQELPDAPNRSAVQARIQVLRRAVEDGSREDTGAQPSPATTGAPSAGATTSSGPPREPMTGSPPTPSVPPADGETTARLSPTAQGDEPAEGGGLHAGVWIAGGLAVVMAGLATGFWLAGDDAYADLLATCGATGCTDRQIEDSGVETYDVLTSAFLIGSLLSAATAGVFLIVGTGGEDDEMRLTSIGLGTRGTW